jgi:hypothetical protein
MMTRPARLRQVFHVVAVAGLAAAAFSLGSVIPVAAHDCVSGADAPRSDEWEGFLRSSDYRVTDAQGRSWIP